MSTGGLDRLFRATCGSVWLPNISESHGGNDDTASWIKYVSEHRRRHTQMLRYTHSHAICIHIYAFAHKCTQTLILHTKTRSFTIYVRQDEHTTSRYTFSVHCLVPLSPHLLTHTHTHTHTYTHSYTHTSSQWCITCSGLAQSPLCLCIRCHCGSNVMSLVSCGPDRGSQADTAANRQDQIRLYNRPPISRM